MQKPKRESPLRKERNKVGVDVDVGVGFGRGDHVGEVQERWQMCLVHVDYVLCRGRGIEDESCTEAGQGRF